MIIIITSIIYTLHMHFLSKRIKLNNIIIVCSECSTVDLFDESTWLLKLIKSVS